MGIFQQIGRESLSALTGLASRVARPNAISATWSPGENWGDALNPYLIRAISGQEVRFEHSRILPKVQVIGSILQWSDARTVVWGPGLISTDARPARRPKQILAVRGPLTRKRLIAMGLSCPEVYGDPALLLPRYLRMPEETRQYIGLIPHYVDRHHPWIQASSRNEAVKVIDVSLPIEQFVREVGTCRCVLSSSLHGLICADSYGLPTKWLDLGGELIGGHFKFMDYYGSLGLFNERPYSPSQATDIADLASRSFLKKLSVDLDKLLAACPFVQTKSPQSRI